MWKITELKISTVREEFPFNISFFKRLWNFILYGNKVVLPGEINYDDVLSFKPGFSYIEFDDFDSALAYLIHDSRGIERDFTANGVVVTATHILFSNEDIQDLKNIKAPKNCWLRYIDSINNEKKISDKHIIDYKTLIYFDCYGTLQRIL